MLFYSLNDNCHIIGYVIKNYLGLLLDYMGNLNLSLIEFYLECLHNFYLNRV